MPPSWACRTSLRQPEAMDFGECSLPAPTTAGRSDGNGPGGQRLQPETRNQCAGCPPVDRTTGISPVFHFQISKTQRPEPVGALDLPVVSAFSHALIWPGFLFQAGACISDRAALPWVRTCPVHACRWQRGVLRPGRRPGAGCAAWRTCAPAGSRRRRRRRRGSGWRGR